MNAYESAKYLEAREINNPHLIEIANLLRQQADRIAELEKQQKTEPDFYSEQGYPLYTTPQIKELSDEEIDSLIAEYKIGEFNGFYVDKAMTESMQRRYKNVLDFARAILKKASEK